jgi:hypothetical protein
MAAVAVHCAVGGCAHGMATARGRQGEGRNSHIAQEAAFSVGDLRPIGQRERCLERKIASAQALNRSSEYSQPPDILDRSSRFIYYIHIV